MNIIIIQTETINSENYKFCYDWNFDTKLVNRNLNTLMLLHTAVVTCVTDELLVENKNSSIKDFVSNCIDNLLGHFNIKLFSESNSNNLLRHHYHRIHAESQNKLLSLELVITKTY